MSMTRSIFTGTDWRKLQPRFDTERTHCALAACAALLSLAACGGGADPTDVSAEESPWSLTEESREHVGDPDLEQRIFQALDAAREAGTDPSTSKFVVRAGTTVTDEGVERAIVGGNSEYAGYAEAIHGETSLMNHVITAIGPEAAKSEVDFVAFYGDRQCTRGGPCGDCRDYLMTTTRWRDLLIVCGQSSDHTVHVHRFAEHVVPESEFPIVAADEIDLPPGRLEELVAAAREARGGGVALFSAADEHLGAAVLTTRGEIYRAAGADDAAFHYRYPIGAALQQAASHRDYFVVAAVVVGSPGTLPRVSYRDRQYGHEASSFNATRDLPPIRLIVVEESADGELRHRVTTFEEALPGAFSAARFMPEAVGRFLDERALD
jgi:cytidine deaminase